MVTRKIVHIDEDKCDGCGLCITACAEGALKLIDGKARLVSDVYCDGLGACLGDCPQGAITIEEREAAEFDEAAVQAHLASQTSRPLPMACPSPGSTGPSGGCPGSQMRQLRPEVSTPGPEDDSVGRSMLGHWPVQLMLVPPQAPFLAGCDLLVCADCVPFAVAGFHRGYLKGRAVVVGCPKLDDLTHYREKLTDIFRVARPRSVTVVKMEVPCCHGIAQATVQAWRASGAQCPIEVQTVAIDGVVVSKQAPSVSGQPVVE
jgi:Pyruvate/2-oxoacid:ferredoxin oxidoreductase delta subunit